MPAIILMSLSRKSGRTQKHDALLFLGVFAVSCRGHLCRYLLGSASSWFPFVWFSLQNHKHLPMKKSRISIISNLWQIHYHPASLSNTSSQVSLLLELSSHLSGPTEVQFPHVRVSLWLRGAEGKASLAGHPPPPETPEEMGHVTVEIRTAWGPAVLPNTPLPEQPGLRKLNIKWNTRVCIHTHVCL